MSVLASWQALEFLGLELTVFLQCMSLDINTETLNYYRLHINVQTHWLIIERILVHTNSKILLQAIACTISPCSKRFTLHVIVLDFWQSWIVSVDFPSGLKRGQGVISHNIENETYQNWSVSIQSCSRKSISTKLVPNLMLHSLLELNAPVCRIFQTGKCKRQDE